MQVQCEQYLNVVQVCSSTINVVEPGTNVASAA